MILHRPSTLEMIIARCPPKLQMLALEAVQEEHDRWAMGDLTESEELVLERARRLGEAAGKHRAQLIMDHLKGEG